MTSSYLCKKAEGAVFPLLVEAMEDGVDNAFDAEFVDEADHGAGAAAHLHKASLDDVGGAQFAPQVLRHVKEGKQIGQVLFEFAHQGGISVPPVRLEGTKRTDGRGAIAGQVDGLRAVFYGGKIAAAHVFENIAHFVHPATLMQHARVNGLNGSG